MTYTVQQLADLAGISVRTLHYYDEIGLLKPSYIKENGYRTYEDKELLKLQQILFFRELEFPLEEIMQIVSAPQFDTFAALQDQRKVLQLRESRLSQLIQTIDQTIQTIQGEKPMNTTSLFSGFDDAQVKQYQEEAKQRWGHTDAYKQSIQRTKNWTKEDYQKATKQWKVFTQKLADTMDEGYDSPAFQALIQQQYDSINSFYDCSLEMFRNLGELYVTDPRFTQNYDKFKLGLAKCVQKAINYYCDLHETK